MQIMYLDHAVNSTKIWKKNDGEKREKRTIDEKSSILF